MSTSAPETAGKPGRVGWLLSGVGMGLLGGLSIVYAMLVGCVILVDLFVGFMIFAMSMSPASAVQGPLLFSLSLDAVAVLLAILCWFVFTRTARDWAMVLMRVGFVAAILAVIALSLSALLFWGIGHR